MNPKIIEPPTLRLTLLLSVWTVLRSNPSSAKQIAVSDEKSITCSFKFQNSAELEDERVEVTRQGSSSGDPLADPSQDAGGSHGIIFYFKNIFNPRWIFYSLSSCGINHTY